MTLTDEEYNEGPDVWETYPDPIHPWNWSKIQKTWKNLRFK